jgi:hypothetical protein
MAILSTALLILTLQAAAAGAPAPPTPLFGDEVADFLRTAEVVEVVDLKSKGITNPRKATLSDGNRTIDAVFKTVDTFHDKVRLTTGRTVFRLKDSYRNEIAAYELARLLGLDLVPPTVERKIGGRSGSLTVWVYDSMTEWDRAKVKMIPPPDPVAWNEQMHVVRLFMQLTWDTDYNNGSNLLIDPNWKIWKIDSSRAFLADKNLRREGTLTHFSRRVLASLEELTREDLDERLGPWLERHQINALWARRARILKLAEKRVAERGEAEVLFP